MSERQAAMSLRGHEQYIAKPMSHVGTAACNFGTAAIYICKLNLNCTPTLIKCISRSTLMCRLPILYAAMYGQLTEPACIKHHIQSDGCSWSPSTTPQLQVFNVVAMLCDARPASHACRVDIG